VAGDKVKHVIKEADACGDCGFAATVEIETEVNLSLFGDAMNVGFSGHGVDGS
jgi:hypothetical protein